MHPVKAVPTRYNPFVNGENPQNTHSSIKPAKTQKTRWVGLFKKNLGFFNPGFLCLSFVFGLDVVFCFVVLVFGCQYQCGNTLLQNDLLCVLLDVKPYSLCHPLTAVISNPISQIKMDFVAS